MLYYCTVLLWYLLGGFFFFTRQLGSAIQHIHTRTHVSRVLLLCRCFSYCLLCPYTAAERHYRSVSQTGKHRQRGNHAQWFGSVYRLKGGGNSAPHEPAESGHSAIYPNPSHEGAATPSQYNSTMAVLRTTSRFHCSEASSRGAAFSSDTLLRIVCIGLHIRTFSCGGVLPHCTAVRTNCHLRGLPRHESYCCCSI